MSAFLGGNLTLLSGLTGALYVLLFTGRGRELPLCLKKLALIRVGVKIEHFQVYEMNQKAGSKKLFC